MNSVLLRQWIVIATPHLEIQKRATQCNNKIYDRGEKADRETFIGRIKKDLVVAESYE